MSASETTDSTNTAPAEESGEISENSPDTANSDVQGNESEPNDSLGPNDSLEPSGEKSEEGPPPIPDYLLEVEDIQSLQPGMIVHRENEQKKQQGHFVKLTDEKDGLIVLNVIDLNAPSLVAEAGIIRPEPGDKIFRHASRFGESPQTDAARRIITEWTLFRNHPEIRNEIVEFTEMTFSPEQVTHLKKREELKQVFIPVQERFQIGKFQKKIDWNEVRRTRFKELVDSLGDGKHITYIAFVPRETNHEPLFYSIGTKPHIETLTNLKREPFAFQPTNGGHIKIISGLEETPRRFLVDAGSNDLGSGVHTSLAIAELVTTALKKILPENEFVPVAGRGAHGLHQSY